MTSDLQDRIRREADEKGRVMLYGAAEHAAARALERRGLVEISDRPVGGLYGGHGRKDRATYAYSLAPDRTSDLIDGLTDDRPSEDRNPRP